MAAVGWLLWEINDTLGRLLFLTGTLRLLTLGLAAGAGLLLRWVASKDSAADRPTSHGSLERGRHV